ncbi:MAG TPA: hypothetical protein VKR06_27300 [Ktedonosporobacter sp.]|nr:hypothetical protein [Ktedonosporobacter sp.]
MSDQKKAASRIYSLRSRRLTIIAFYMTFLLGLFLWYLGWGAPGQTPLSHVGWELSRNPPFLLGMLVVPMALPIWLLICLTRMTQNIAHRPVRFLNERERAIRERAYPLAFRVLTLVVVVGMVLLFINLYGDILNDATIATIKRIGFLINWEVLVYVTSLPTVIIAWHERELFPSQE